MLEHATEEHPWQAGLEAAKLNLLPGALLWVVAGAVVGGYYLSPSVRDLFTQVAHLRAHYGLGFAIVSTALFGALLPTLIQQGFPKLRKACPRPLRSLPFLLIFWGLKGIEIDLFYHAQAVIFGDATTISAVLPKMVVDQLIYVPLWAIPTTVLPFLWKDCGYSLTRTRAALGTHWYRRRGVPLMLANWGVWVPTVVLIYCLPLALQLPLQNIVLCLWSLLVIAMTQKADLRGGGPECLAGSGTIAADA